MTAQGTNNRSWQERVAPIFSVLGGVLIVGSFLVGTVLLAPVAARYFGGNPKAARDAAEAGSTLLGQLQLLQVTPRWLTPLTFLGVASFMTGIALLFSTIPGTLVNRAKIMGLCFPQITRLGGEQGPVRKDDPPGMPFSMIEGMMPAWPLIALMGWMIVLLSLLVAIFVLSPAQATFFSDAKAVREGAQVGSAFVNANVTAHVVETWVPQFKFLGLGLGLMAIVMALGTIAKKLRRMGFVLSSHIPEALRPQMPPIPKRVRVFQLSTVMGVMVLVAALVIGVVLAVGVVPAYWNHSIADTLNTAGSGSALLGQLAVVRSFALWLDPLRMVGMALLFTAITIALTVIIKTLRVQGMLLSRFYNAVTSG